MRRKLVLRMLFQFGLLMALGLAALIPFVLGLVAVPSAVGQTFELLYSFPPGAYGGGPRAALVQDAAGNLYGTTQSGGATSTCSPPDGCGVVFKLSPTGTETVLYTFSEGADGENSYARLLRDGSGQLVRHHRSRRKLGGRYRFQAQP